MEQGYPLFLVVIGEKSVRLIVGWNDNCEPLTVRLGEPMQIMEYIHHQDCQVFIDQAGATAFARKQRAVATS